MNTVLYAADMEAFYQKVRTTFDSIQTLQADIAQTNEFAQTKTKLISSGTLYYEPNKLLIDYNKPSIQKLIIKGNSVLIYDKDSKTLIKTTNGEGVSNPLQLVDRYWSSSRKELLTADSVTTRMRLYPPKHENIKKLEVNFDNSTKMISELAYWDSLGNKVKFRFLSVRTGVVIPSSKWSFTPPSGVKTIQR